jgi:hypothetical protein
MKNVGVDKITYSTGIESEMFETLRLRDMPSGSCYCTLGSLVASDVLVT